MGDPQTLPAAGSAADILEVNDSDLLAVEVPEWKRTVFIRVLSAGAALELQEKVEALPAERKSDSVYFNVAQCVVDAKGAPLFKLEDCIDKLKTRNQRVLVRLHELANAHNNTKRGTPEAAKND